MGYKKRRRTSLIKHKNKIKEDVFRKKKRESDSRKELKELKRKVKEGYFLEVQKNDEDPVKNTEYQVFEKKHTDAKKQYADVGAEAGMTVNLGDYNSLRLSMSIRVPVDITGLTKQEIMDKLTRTQEYLANTNIKKLEKVIREQQAK